MFPHTNNEIMEHLLITCPSSNFDAGSYSFQISLVFFWMATVSDVSFDHLLGDRMNLHFYSFGLHRSVSKVHDEWFADEENVRKTVGLLEKQIEMPNKREVFPILTIEFLLLF